MHSARSRHSLRRKDSDEGHAIATDRKFQNTHSETDRVPLMLPVHNCSADADSRSRRRCVCIRSIYADLHHTHT